jgi:hypothetical protein
MTKTVAIMTDIDDDNMTHAYRHARHALEDFMALEARMRHSHELMNLYGRELHAISHHLRHAVFRIGKR